MSHVADPMGLNGFEFVEFAGPRPALMAETFEKRTTKFEEPRNSPPPRLPWRSAARQSRGRSWRGWFFRCPWDMPPF